ncbi:hypothetical protein BCR37DRAFT_91890 [Protomyces lactucae-debilis]|uniref:Uncharacterized protein n=1 Tax=Protomyces lactucae-debilis TaxID=2754530 RepID=A0A1Y2F723_PROLT|nr:uncharacterized protein BCR37DRAFT_91890 [Protomyces lactucae-debilis]ORY79457.1 hypothetical protein BCR37DRAFT_91890 [Protomyces lactucae-debilis]
MSSDAFAVDVQILDDRDLVHDYTNMPFTPVHSLLGGSLLFLASQQYMLLFDKTFGCSSILAQTILHPAAAIEGLQAPAFAGMLLASYLYTTQARSLLPPALSLVPEQKLAGDLGKQALAGLLVGLGTRLANGCTSGHMLNGLAKLSVRSFVATCCFFGSAVATVALFNTAPGPGRDLLQGSFFTAAPIAADTVTRLLYLVGFAISVNASCFYLRKIQQRRDSSKPASSTYRFIAAFLAGATFATGLLMSGMSMPTKTLGFLNVLQAWRGVPGAEFDPSLLMIVLGGLLPNLIMTQLYTKSQRPLMATGTQAPASGKGQVTKRLVGGSLLFGIGWGISGICPGPAIVNLVSSWPLSTDFVTFFASLVVGSKVAEYV